MESNLSPRFAEILAAHGMADVPTLTDAVTPDEAKNTLTRAALKQRDRRFSGESITGFGALGEPNARFADFDEQPVTVVGAGDLEALDAHQMQVDLQAEYAKERGR